MPIEFNCDQCGTLLRIADEHAGKKGRCPTCRTLFDIPGGTTSADLGFNPFQVDAATTDYVKTPPKPDYAKDKNPYASPPPAPIRPRRYQQPHRGPQVLVFAILGLACCLLFGIFAWSMANEDLAKMRSGVMDPAGQGMTQAGRVIAIVSLVLLGVSLVLNVVFSLLGATF